MNRRHLLSAALGIATASWAGASSAVAAVRLSRATTTTKPKPPTTTTTKPPTTTTTKPPATSTSTLASKPPVWPQIARVSDVAVGQSVSFSFGTTSKYSAGSKSCAGAWSCGGTGILYRSTASTWSAYEANCTHAGVGLSAPRTGATVTCPAHGSQFSLLTGAAVRGPAAQKLAAVTVAARADGYVYWLND
jgi:nitrite reductase/ring-hydroxylating ferredoxin subunit